MTRRDKHHDDSAAIFDGLAELVAEMPASEFQAEFRASGEDEAATASRIRSLLRSAAVRSDIPADEVASLQQEECDEPLYPTPCNRFLEVAQEMGLITPSVSRMVEDRIARGRLDAAMADEFLVAHGLMSAGTRVGVLETVRALSGGAAGQNLAGTSNVNEKRWKEGLVALAAIVALGLLTQVLVIDGTWSISIVSFSAWIFVWQLSSRQTRTFSQTVVRGLKWGLVVASVAVVSAAAYNVSSLTGTLAADLELAKRSALKSHQHRLSILLSMLAALLLTVSWLALLKSRGVRYAEGRMGKLTDTINNIERIIKRRDQELVQLRAATESAILRGLYHAVGIAPGRIVYDYLRRLSPTLGRCMVVLLEPDASRGTLSIKQVVHAPDASQKVLDAIELFKKHHRPAIPDINEWERLCKLARGDSDETWPHIYLRFPRAVRSRVMSTAGWTLVHGQMTYEEDATKSLTFDHSYLTMLRNEGVEERAIRWLEVNSFIAAPVMDPEGEVESVLMVTSTSKRGFRSQDFDLVMAMSRLLTSTRHRTLRGKDHARQFNPPFSRSNVG